MPILNDGFVAVWGMVIYMENLFIETKSGNIPIDKEFIEKNNLKKGMISPFTRNRIVGENNDFPSRSSMMKDSKNGLLNEDPEDTENVMLSTSEILDFSQGEDSHSDQ